MTIIRRRHNKNFTVIGNEVFSDETLELDALGLLCYLRSRPNDWNISTDHLRRRFGCGPEKMQRLMRALIETGWILRQDAPRGQRGRYGGFEYVVLDEPDIGAAAQGNGSEIPISPESEKPFHVPESGSPTPAEPESVERESVEPESDNPTPYKELDSNKQTPLNPPVVGGTRSIEERISEREALAGRGPEPDTARRPRAGRGCRGVAPTPSLVPPETAARFERLWAAYPLSGRLATGRAEAIARFAELTPAEQAQAIATASAYAASCTALRSQAKALHRWIRDGRWRNGQPTQGGLFAAGAPTRVFVVDGSPEWDAWAAHYRRIGRPMPTPTRIGSEDGWRFDSPMPPAAEVA